jgi:hypothetical protein
MKKSFLLLLVMIFYSAFSWGQVGIGTSSPSTAAKLDISATDKGLLPPRIALTGASNSAPITGQLEAGLLIYNTATISDVTPGYYYWSGSAWKRLISPSEDSYPISVSNGGTGSTSLTANRVLLGNGTSALQTVAPGTSGNVLTSNGTTWASTAPVTPSSFSSDITVNGIKVGRGTGNVGGNTVLGGSALFSNTTGYYNTSIGYAAGYANTTGKENTSMGVSAGQSLTTGDNNTFVGVNSDVSVGSIYNSTAIGHSAEVTESNTIKLGNGNITKLITQGKLVSGALTYPNEDGTSGQVLTTNGSGAASWQSPATSGIVEIGGGNYGITTILGSGNFTADYTNSHLSYMKVGNMVFFTAIIGKFTMNSNQRQEFEFRPPIASSFANSWDASGTITAYSSGSNTSISGSVVANPVYNATTQSYNLKLSFVVTNATATNVFVSVSGSYIVR